MAEEVPAGALPFARDLEVLSEADAELSSLGSFSDTDVEEFHTGDTSGKAWTRWSNNAVFKIETAAEVFLHVQSMADERLSNIYTVS